MFRKFFENLFMRQLEKRIDDVFDRLPKISLVPEIDENGNTWWYVAEDVRREDGHNLWDITHGKFDEDHYEDASALRLHLKEEQLLKAILQ